MTRALLWIVLLVVTAGLVAGFVVGWSPWGGGDTSTRPDVAASVDYIRQIGELSVMRASVKEIVTSRVGEPGWFTKQGKLAIICHFDITYTYDLRKARIAAGSRDDGTRYCMIHLPRHEFVISTKEIRFYDDQDGTWLGFVQRTPPDARTLALDAARQEAEKQAKGFMIQMEGEIQNSARATLGQIAQAFGFTDITFEFEK